MHRLFLRVQLGNHPVVVFDNPFYVLHKLVTRQVGVQQFHLVTLVLLRQPYGIGSYQHLAQDKRKTLNLVEITDPYSVFLSEPCHVQGVRFSYNYRDVGFAENLVLL